MKYRGLLCATALVTTSLIGSPTFAQENKEPATGPTAINKTEKQEEPAPVVTVTGTRIARPTLESSVPITSIDRNSLLLTGSQTLGDALSNLPSLRATFTSERKFEVDGGGSFLDLRGLGLERTLVLVDGRRHVSSVPGTFRIDTNLIPSDLVSQIDIVTGGNSAVYGADAIAGVVNFIMKKNFRGLRANAQSGVSGRGDYGRLSASITAGHNFDDGRGNIAGSVQYNRNSSVLSSSRPEQTGALVGFSGFFQVDDTIDESRTGDGIPDNIFLRGGRIANTSSGGTFEAICDDPIAAPLSCDSNGLNRLFRFNSQGRLVAAATPTRDLRTLGGTSQIGGDGYITSPVTSLNPLQEMVFGTVMARYDVTDAFQPFVEAKFARSTDSARDEGSSTNGICPSTAFDSVNFVLDRYGASSEQCEGGQLRSAFIRYDNAFLNPADADVIRDIQNKAIDAAIGPDGSSLFPSQGFYLNRQNNDFRGGALQHNRRDLYRAVAGVGGKFNDDWQYEVAGTYGETRGRQIIENNLLGKQFQNALDSVRVGGRAVCRVNADALRTNDDAACVPINILGNGAPSREALDYVMTTSFQKSRSSQFDVTAFIKGDSSQLFALPGGPVSFVLGGEYRRETAFVSNDAVTRKGGTFLDVRPDFSPPAFAVKEGFAELVFPFLKDQKFANLLTLNLAGRLSDYNRGAGATNGTKTYNIGLVYAPIPDIRFRGGISRAVRSPTPYDLFLPRTLIASFLFDPCDLNNINEGSSTRPANCRAAGVPVGYEQEAFSFTSFFQGNQALKEETATSLTLGVIVKPEFARGLTMTIDYFDVDVKNQINLVSDSQILDSCFDAPTLNNQFCRFLKPRLTGGSLDPIGASMLTVVNFASKRSRGIDVDLKYGRSFDDGDRVDVSFLATYLLERTDYQDINNPKFGNRVKGELLDSTFKAGVSASYTTGDLTFGYSMRYVGRQFIGEAENYRKFQGRGPQNPDLTSEIFFPDVFYHNIRFGYEVSTRFRLLLGIDNVGDTLPPFNEKFGSYDTVGRNFYAAIDVRF